jgi:hypothetical protein
VHNNGVAIHFDALQEDRRWKALLMSCITSNCAHTDLHLHVQSIIACRFWQCQNISTHI